MKDLRVDYSKGALEENKVSPDAIVQFQKWFEEAQEAGVKEPNAFVLSTAVNNEVSSRTVLLKDLREGEFYFYTNLNSNKAQALLSNGKCAMNFPWYIMERQIKIKGQASLVDETIAKDYFNSRPRKSQLGAWASEQSKAINSREELEAQFSEVEKRFTNEELVKPEHWGGFKIKPTQIEFWQGRRSRLHDRLLYTLEKGGEWNITRLQP